MDTQVAELVTYFQSQKSLGLRPILWVGAGASAAAGYPTLAGLETLLRAQMPGVTRTGFDLIDAYIDRYSKAQLSTFLETHLGAPKNFATLHGFLARLAGAGCFHAIFTTNYDELLEDALKHEGTAFVPQILEQNFVLGGRESLHLLKLHGSRTDWKSCVLSSASYAQFKDSYPLLKNQLDLNLRHHPLFFIGCSMRDPRLLDWLRELGAARDDLFGGRAVLTQADWGRLTDDERALYKSARIQPVLVETHADIATLLGRLAKQIAPPAARHLVFDLSPGETTWTAVGPTNESAPHQVPNPLTDESFIRMLLEFRRSASTFMQEGDPSAATIQTALEQLARTLGSRLTEVLVSPEVRARVQARMHAKDLGRPQLVIRVTGKSLLDDRALALPWELLMPEPGSFAVRDGQLDLVREAVVPGAPVLQEPTEPLSVAVTIAAPSDQTALRYEDEAFRLHQSLATLGHRVAFADLGTTEDCVRLAERITPTVLHFSGHGLPGGLVFEDEEGFSRIVRIDDLVKDLNVMLVPSGQPRPFPRLFFLASCYGASGDPSGASFDASHESSGLGGTRDARHAELDASLGRGPSTAASLHRHGFVQVVGYFGPVSDPLCTRAEEAFYKALGEGKTTLQAAAEARATLSTPLSVDKSRFVAPLAWAQLALYHRGPDHPLCRPGKDMSSPVPGRISRATVQVSGMPVLEHGFIGRRSLLHLIRQRVKTGQRLLVLQGLGGLGKTALASHLVSRVLASGLADVLILRCGELDPRNPLPALRAQAEEHGRTFGLADWENLLLQLRDKHVDPLAGFEATVHLIRSERPKILLYVDNAETLQSGPVGEDTDALGEWLPVARPWWQVVERLAQGGLVLVSTRYKWRGLDPEAHVQIDPLPRADVLRMIETFPELGRVPYSVHVKIAKRADGHPRTIEVLDRLVGEHRRNKGWAWDEVKDAWTELIEPVLPAGAQAITRDLLLNEVWERWPEEVRDHARALLVLRAPAPAEVVEALGSAAERLRAAGWLSLVRLQVRRGDKLEWLDRWAVHRIVADFIASRSVGGGVEEVHQKAGAAYGRLRNNNSGAPLADIQEESFHLHAAKEGNAAWPLVEMFVLYLRHTARYQEALEMLSHCEAAGTTGDLLARALILQAQFRVQIGERKEELATLLDRASSLAETEATRSAVLHELGSLRKDQGQYREAESLLRRSLAIKEQTLDADHPSYGASLHTLADILESQGKYPEAEGLLQRALTIKEKALGAGHPDYGTSLHALAGVMGSQGQYSEAEGLLRRALAIKEKALRADHPEYGASLRALAGVLSQQGKYLEAEGLLRRALAIIERALGSDHPSYSASLHTLAGVLSRQGKYLEAEGLLHRALAIKEKALGEDHPDYGTSLHSLAGVMESQGKYSEAESLLIKVLAITERALGAGHPDYGASLHALAGVLESQGKYLEAEGLLRRALALAEKALGADHPSCSAFLLALAGVLSHQGKYLEAESLLRRALTIKEKVLGEEHPDYGASLHTLAGVLSHQGKYLEAERLLRRALALMEKALGSDHPDYGTSLDALAGVLSLQGKYPEAEGLSRRALAIEKRTLGTDHPDYGTFLHTLASILSRQGKYPEAEGFLRKALVIEEMALGADHPNYGSSLHALAGVLFHEGKYLEAEGLLRKALAVKEKALGADHPALCPTLANLGSVLMKQDRPADGLHLVERALQIGTATHGRNHPDIAQTLLTLAQLQAATRHPGAPGTAREALETLERTLGPEHPIAQQARSVLRNIMGG